CDVAFSANAQNLGSCKNIGCQTTNPCPDEACETGRDYLFSGKTDRLNGFRACSNNGLLTLEQFQEPNANDLANGSNEADCASCCGEVENDLDINEIFNDQACITACSTKQSCFGLDSESVLGCLTALDFLTSSQVNFAGSNFVCDPQVVVDTLSPTNAPSQ